MATYEVAHLREQGIDLIIVLLSPAFGNAPSAEQDQVIDDLQVCAADAGLAGTVVPVWQQGGRLRFIAPENWHPYFRGLSWTFVLRNVNRKLTCS